MKKLTLKPKGREIIDITMCTRKDCPKRYTCLRSVLKPKSHQSYSDFRDICEKDNNYQYYIFV